MALEMYSLDVIYKKKKIIIIKGTIVTWEAHHVGLMFLLIPVASELCKVQPTRSYKWFCVFFNSLTSIL